MSVFLRTEAELAARLPLLAKANEIALDTEFHPERTYYPKPLLIQLRADESEVLLIDATAIADLRELAELLCDRPLLVHGGAADVGIIQRLAGRPPREVYDTQVAAGFVGTGFPRALRDLCAHFLGRVLDKGETLSDWSRRPLSPDQLRYAAEDVLVLAPLALAIRQRVEKSPFAAELAECLRERLAAWVAPPDDASAWCRMHNAHLLADERGALQALAAWREYTAREANVPAHSVVSDAMLQDLARRQPKTLGQLRDNRRMPTGVWKAYGETLLGVLRDRDRAPISAPPTGLAIDLARLAARVAETESGVAADLVWADCKIDYFLEEKNRDGWRRAVLGQKWHDFIDGKRTIAMPGRWC